MSIANIFASPPQPLPQKLNEEEKLIKKRKKKEEKLESVAVELLSSPLNSPGKLKRKNKKMHDEVEIEVTKPEKPPKVEKVPKPEKEKGKPGRKRKQSEHDALKALASVASQRNSPLGTGEFIIEDSKTPFGRYKKKKLTLNLDDENGADNRMLDAMSPDTNTDPLFSPPNNSHSSMSFYNHGNNIGISSYHPSGDHDHRQILASPMSNIPLLPITPTPSSHSRFMMHASSHRMSPSSVVQKRRYIFCIILY